MEEVDQLLRDLDTGLRCAGIRARDYALDPSPTGRTALQGATEARGAPPLANGLLSVVSNLIWMRIFIGWLGIPPVPANLMAIALTSVANFLFGRPLGVSKSFRVGSVVGTM